MTDRADEWNRLLNRLNEIQSTAGGSDSLFAKDQSQVLSLAQVQALLGHVKPEVVLSQLNSHYPKLDSASERFLLYEAQAGTNSAATREVATIILICHFAYLISNRANTANETDRGDVLQHGMMGLARAIKRFDPNRGQRSEDGFAAFASVAIANEIRDFYNRRRMIHIPANARRLVAEYDEAVCRLTIEGAPSDPASVAQVLGISGNQLLEVLRIKSYMDVTLIDPISYDHGVSERQTEQTAVTDDDAENGPPDESGEQPECAEEVVRDVAHLNETAAEHELLRELLKKLDKGPAEILTLHYGIGEKPHKLKEIAKLKGVSESAISQREKRAIENLRRLFRDHNPRSRA